MKQIGEGFVVSLPKSMQQENCLDCLHMFLQFSIQNYRLSNSKEV